MNINNYMNIKYDTKMLNEIKDRYINGDNLTTIGTDYNVSATTIKRWLLKENIIIDSKRRSPWNKNKKLGSHYAWNYGLTKETNNTLKIVGEKIKEKHINGLIKTRTISPEVEKERREKIRISINKRYDSGWMPKAGRCKKITYNSPYAGEVLLDGTWELLFAKYLDENHINWKRNKTRFVYIFENKSRHYTPDFFLPDNSVYIEVKGYMTEKDIAKWNQFPHKILIIKKEQIFNIKQNKKINLEVEPNKRIGIVC